MQPVIMPKSESKSSVVTDFMGVLQNGVLRQLGAVRAAIPSRSAAARASVERVSRRLGCE